MGNIRFEEYKNDGLDDEKSIGRTECCLSKIEKLAVTARVDLLQSTNIWVGDLGVSVHSIINRCRGSNTCKGSGAGTVGAHG